MAEKKGEKNLGAMVEEGLVDAFTEQVDGRGYKIKRSLAAAVRLWVDLPEEIQARLLNQTLAANGLVEIVQGIVDERIQAGKKAAQKLAGPRSRKPGQKD